MPSRRIEENFLRLYEAESTPLFRHCSLRLFDRERARPPCSWQYFSLLPVVFIGVLLSACVEEATNPLSNASQRATPLEFGLYVTPDPAYNPIHPPENFTGYHTAVDFEVSAEELSEDVPVFAICAGEVIYSSFATGYGGLIVHRCVLDHDDVTVLYGHVALDNLPQVGSILTAGEQIAHLAPAHSRESGMTRKHLHFGIHRGKEQDVRGYVDSIDELNQFIDPITVLPWMRKSFRRETIHPYWDQQDEIDAESPVNKGL
ncbi:MAG TPA: M23 family metallopeptidase [Candidatus Peribacterales bacterium]|nr:M23 family metallopeptidase [Candidatus Peribacterales bacterium]